MIYSSNRISEFSNENSFSSALQKSFQKISLTHLNSSFDIEERFGILVSLKNQNNFLALHGTTENKKKEIYVLNNTKKKLYQDILFLLIGVQYTSCKCNATKYEKYTAPCTRIRKYLLFQEIVFFLNVKKYMRILISIPVILYRKGSITYKVSALSFHHFAIFHIVTS